MNKINMNKMNMNNKMNYSNSNSCDKHKYK